MESGNGYLKPFCFEVFSSKSFINQEILLVVLQVKMFKEVYNVNVLKTCQ